MPQTLFFIFPFFQWRRLVEKRAVEFKSKSTQNADSLVADSTIRLEEIDRMTSFARPGEELIELVWQDGQVIMQTQKSQRGAEIDEQDRDHTSRSVRSYQKPNNPIQENETASWFPCNVDVLERELCSEFFYGTPSMDADGLCYDAVEGEGCRNLRPTKDAIGTDAQICNLDTGGFTHSYCPQSDTRKESRRPNKKSVENPINPIRRDIGQSSSKISSNCGSNQFAIPPEPSQGLRNDATSSREVTNAQTMSTRMRRQELSQTITSSYAASGSTTGKAIDNNCNKDKQKRKQVEYEDTEFQSEDWEDCLVEPSNQLQRSTSTRRSRSAQVHNLSERRRRDRINEKLKALQNLIPNCNKTDKASVLDEAIEYLKSLQLQVQFMWMGNGMARMMLPNLQNYLLGLGMGMAHGSAMPTTIPGSNQMPTPPIFNQHLTSPNPPDQQRSSSFPSGLPFDQPSQIQQNLDLADIYGRFLGIQPTQQSPQLNPPAGGLPL